MDKILEIKLKEVSMKYDDDYVCGGGGDVYDVGDDGDDKQIERSVSHLLFSSL